MLTDFNEVAAENLMLVTVWLTIGFILMEVFKVQKEHIDCFVFFC